MTRNTRTTLRAFVMGTIAVWAATSAGAAGGAELQSLIPLPSRVDRTGDGFTLSAKTTICAYGPDEARCRFIAERLSGLIDEEFKTRLPVMTEQGSKRWQLFIGDKAAAKRPSVLREGDDGALGEEGYRLEIDAQGGRAAANTYRGLLWAAMTFRQLLRPDGPTAPGVRIEDVPRYAWRGFMIDSGRSPNSPAQMKRIARICSTFKLNCLVFREGDDELNAVRYRGNNLGRENPHALTMEQVADFVAYCDRLGIAVIPEIESLGHSTAKGFAYPGLVAGGFEQKYEGVGVHIRKSHLKLDDPRSLQLLESIYDEWVPLLKSPFMHLGLDEVRLPKDLQAQHLAKLLPVVQRVADKHGRTVRPMVWSDAPPTPEAFRDRVVRVFWEYADGKAVSLENKHLLNQHIDTLAAPGCREAVFMAAGSGSKHTPYAKSDYEGAFRNLASWAAFGKQRENFIGLMAVQWSGNMLDLWVPDFAVAGDVGWSPPATPPPFNEQMNRVRAQLARLADASHPASEEVDRPAWDGIWLDGQRWGRDALPKRPTTQP